MPPARSLLLLGVAPLLLAASDCDTPRAVPVTMLGDSITWGYVTEPGGPSYPDLLDALPLFDVRNLAVPGTLARSWSSGLVFFAAAGLEFGGEIVTLLIGTNDALQHVSPEEYRAHVDFSAGFALALGAEWVVLMTPPPAPDPPDDPVQRELLLAYRADLFEICASRARVVCGPDVHSLLDPRIHMPPGDVHLNGPAHRVVARALGRTLWKLGLDPGRRRAGGSGA